MSYNDYMYAVDRSDKYLAHYGIKGMKWGIRKAIESGNARKLDRAYRKASKKLAKLEKRANSGAKYARRAAALGAGAAAAGGLAALGTGGIGGLVKNSSRVVIPGAQAVGKGLKAGGKAIENLAFVTNGKVPGLTQAAEKIAPTMKSAGDKVGGNAYKAGMAVRKAGGNIVRWGNRKDAGNAIANVGSKAYDKLTYNPTGAQVANRVNTALTNAGHGEIGHYINNARGISNNTIARAGAAALGAGLAGAAGYNAYRAATTKRAARKAAEFRSEMNKALAGTKYADGGRPSKKRRHR